MKKEIQGKKERVDKGERGGRKKYLNNKIQSYSNHVNMHNHSFCINFGNAQCYRRTSGGRF